MQPGTTFTARALLVGETSASGPSSYLTTAHLLLFGEPSGGTLSGTRLMQGNTAEDLDSVPGLWAALIQTIPVCRRVQNHVK